MHSDCDWDWRDSLMKCGLTNQTENILFPGDLGHISLVTFMTAAELLVVHLMCDNQPIGTISSRGATHRAESRIVPKG